jgi:Arc/MetJ-type ribon-helix-helix transcriptional regulator
VADTDRVTLRLPADDLEQLDMMVDIGEFANRSEAIRTAIRDLIRSRADKVAEDVEARRTLQESYQRHLELEDTKAQLEEAREALDDLR